jgi:hypothetical protein
VAEPTPAAGVAAPDPRASRPRRSALAQGADRNRLPAAPVLQAIQRRARVRRQSLRQLLGPELFSTYGNAQATGTISLLTLERFCDEVLGWHPRMLYGEAYDHAAIAPHP